MIAMPDDSVDYEPGVLRVLQGKAVADGSS